MKVPRLPRLHCALLGLLPFGPQRAGSIVQRDAVVRSQQDVLDDDTKRLNISIPFVNVTANSKSGF